MAQDPELDLSLINAMGDRDKGMDAAGVAQIGMLNWSSCITHFTNNIGTQFKGCGLGIRLKIKTAAALYTQAEANVLLQEIQRENPAIHEYILNAGLQNFFRSRTEHARFDIISNQAIESWNKITRPWRELPRLAYLLKVEEKVASIFSKRLQQINAAQQADIRDTALVPKVSEQTTASMEESNHYEALQIQPSILGFMFPSLQALGR